MLVDSCIPIIPSLDLEKSLHFWVEGLQLTVANHMRREGRLVGCMVHGGHLSFWLNERVGTATRPENYEGIRLYWASVDIHGIRERLVRLGYGPSEIVDRDYGQTEFFVTDADGHSHCFGVPTQGGSAS